MQHLITIFLSCVLLSHTVAAYSATEPDPEAIRIIEEFGLSESEAAVASLPNWQPQRVVVSLPSSLSKRLPGLEENLVATAGAVDLVAALESGKLYGAGLDVTDPEPLPADNPLWQMSNVIITPHASAAGRDSIQRTAVIAVENLRRYLAGERLLNVVNMRAGY